MVDCIYYEKQSLDKSRAEKILLDYFGKNFKAFNINETSKGESVGSDNFLTDYFLTKEEILNPEKDSYIVIKKILCILKDNRPDLIGGTKYNDLLMVLAAMTDCITVSQMEEWEADPRLTLLKE